MGHLTGKVTILMYSMNIKIFFFLAWKKRGRGSRAGTKEYKQTQKEVKKQEENYESERLAEVESSLRAESTHCLLTQTQRLSEDNLRSKRWLSAILILMFEGTHAPHISECLKSLKSLSNLCPLYEGLHRTMEKS